MTARPKIFQHIAILGLARSGRAALHKAMALGIDAVWYDDHITDIAPELPPPTPPEAWGWSSLDGVIISPGIPHHHPAPHAVAQMARRHNIPLISEVEFALQVMEIPALITVTGTNGKSTTTALLGHICATNQMEVAVGGNIGTPLSALPHLKAQGVYILEMSSYQLEITPSLSSDIAIILNITPDHLDPAWWHGGLCGSQATRAHFRKAKRACHFRVGKTFRSSRPPPMSRTSTYKG